MIGIGYQESRALRKEELGSNIESKGNEEFQIYFGRAHITDIDSNLEARGKLKIGRAKYKTAVQRGRNQPGVDFRIYAQINVSTNAETYALEDILKSEFKDRNVIGSQGQRELYDFADCEITSIVDHLKAIGIKRGINVLGSKVYMS